MSFTPPEPWFTLLTDPENRDMLELALCGLPEGRLAATYKAAVDPQDKRSYLTVGTPLKDLTDRHVLARLGRIAERLPRVAERLAAVWLEENETALRDFGAGKTTARPPSPDWLRVALWLWENTDQTEPPTWAAVTGWLDQLFQSYRDQQARVGAEGAEVKRLRGEMVRLERRLRGVETQREQLQGEVYGLKNELKAKTGEVARLERDLQTQWSRAEQWQAEIDRRGQVLGARDRALQDLQGEYDRLRADLFDRDRQLSEQLEQNQRLLERVRQLDSQIGQRETEVRRLEQEVSRMRQHQGLPGSADLLERALLIDYPALAPDPARRLIGLLQLYRAFLEGRPHQLLDEHTNLPAHRHAPPAGILLLGLEQLLHDGIHLPLERFLKTSTFGVETVLHKLLLHPASPRLEPEGAE